MHAVATRTAKTGERAFVKRVCEMVDVELGSTLPCLDKTPFTAFLCCHAGRCISFLLVERITEAMPMTSAHELDLSRKTDAVLGVNRMWTVKSFRGKGLMQALLDYAREKLVYGCVIGVKEVAFTQLSGSGEAFAKTYTGMHEPLIYRD
jgi:GNAT superfamily N-acetyltransferase